MILNSKELEYVVKTYLKFTENGYKIESCEKNELGEILIRLEPITLSEKEN